MNYKPLDRHTNSPKAVNSNRIKSKFGLITAIYTPF